MKATNHKVVTRASPPLDVGSVTGGTPTDKHRAVSGVENHSPGSHGRGTHFGDEAGGRFAVLAPPRRPRRPVPAERALLARAHENYLTAIRVHNDAVAGATAGDFRAHAHAATAYLVMQIARDQFRQARTAARLVGAA